MRQFNSFRRFIRFLMNRRQTPKVNKVWQCGAMATDRAMQPCEYRGDDQTGFGFGIEMTRKSWNLLLTVAPLALVVGVPALGADMAVKAPLYKAPMAAPYSWTGWYIGANAGYGLGNKQGN